eukprot:2419146-Alexandrium_andersonii.AAC.1
MRLEQVTDFTLGTLPYQDPRLRRVLAPSRWGHTLTPSFPCPPLWGLLVHSGKSSIMFSSASSLPKLQPCYWIVTLLGILPSFPCPLPSPPGSVSTP